MWLKQNYIGLPQQFMDWLQTFDINILTYIKFYAVAILKPITGLFSKKEVNLHIAYIKQKYQFLAWFNETLLENLWEFLCHMWDRAGVSTA